ncbi:MAG: hypothetical protein V4501_05190 [Pseudomonadota bacterium]
MLNRHHAELELKQAIQKLVPDWQDKGEDYIDALLAILPDFFAGKTPHDATPKVALLRRRLVNILAKEQELQLDKSLCDTVFNVQLALAKLFPFNKEASADDAEQLSVEAWEETFTFEIITRETKDLIIFPESPMLTRASTLEYYQGRFGKDEEGNPRNFDNTLMSERQILSLQQQGITFNNIAEGFDFEDEIEHSENLGKYIGEKLGQAVTYSAAIVVMLLSRGPVLFSASLVVGAVTTCAEGPKGFHSGFLATFLLGATAQTSFMIAINVGNVSGAVGEDTACLAQTLLSTSLLQLVLPALVFVAAVVKAHQQNQNLSATYTNITANFFFKAPIQYLAQQGEAIGNSISRNNLPVTI